MWHNVVQLHAAHLHTRVLIYIQCSTFVNTIDLSYVAANYSRSIGRKFLTPIHKRMNTEYLSR